MTAVPDDAPLPAVAGWRPYRILVTGSRDWISLTPIEFNLGRAIRTAQVTGHVVTVVHGGCPDGADLIADTVARKLDATPEPRPVTRADWRRYGNSAGPRRNAEMVALGADECWAFAMPCSRPDHRRRPPHASHGTAGCAALAEAAGIRVCRVTRGEDAGMDW